MTVISEMTVTFFSFRELLRKLPTMLLFNGLEFSAVQHISKTKTCSAWYSQTSETYFKNNITNM